MPKWNKTNKASIYRISRFQNQPNEASTPPSTPEHEAVANAMAWPEALPLVFHEWLTVYLVKALGCNWIVCQAILSSMRSTISHDQAQDAYRKLSQRPHNTLSSFIIRGARNSMQCCLNASLRFDVMCYAASEMSEMRLFIYLFKKTTPMTWVQAQCQLWADGRALLRLFDDDNRATQARDLVYPREIQLYGPHWLARLEQIVDHLLAVAKQLS
jgi:hypothetical protein